MLVTAFAVTHSRPQGLTVVGGGHERQRLHLLGQGRDKSYGSGKQEDEELRFGPTEVGVTFPRTEKSMVNPGKDLHNWAWMTY